MEGFFDSIPGARRISTMLPNKIGLSLHNKSKKIFKIFSHVRNYAYIYL
jgi:hypothetical protein